MQTPPIQTLITDAQQVLNLKSLSEIRATTAAALASANVGDPLNPALTTQQLWDEFYEIVRQTPTDIESIITQQLMKFLYFPPAPGGLSGDQEVIFNAGGFLTGDPGLKYNQATDTLTIGTRLLVGVSNAATIGNPAIGVVGGALYDGQFSLIGNFTNDNTSAGKGVLLGFNNTTNNGIIAAAYGNGTEGLTFWTHNGSGWGQRMELSAAGNLSLLSDKYLGWGNLDSLIYGSSTSNFIYFRTNATEQVRIDGSGNVDLKNGNVKVSNAKGIDFSATPQPAGMTSELLNDYEEGTFTPTIVGSGTTGTGTYTTQTGRYTKIGNQVTVQIYFFWTAHTGTGDMFVTGLPFTLANVSGLYPGVAFGIIENITLSAGKYLIGYGNLNTTNLILLQYPTGGGPVAGVPIDTSGSFSCTMTYQAA